MCMLNMQSKFPGDRDAAGEDHTQGTFDVAVVTIQVLLIAKQWARHYQGALIAAAYHNHLTT